MSIWITRDKDGFLWLFTEGKPKRDKGKFWVAARKTVDNIHVENPKLLNGELCTELKWEDEPIEIEMFRKREVGEKELDDIAEKGIGLTDAGREAMKKDYTLFSAITMSLNAYKQGYFAGRKREGDEI